MQFEPNYLYALKANNFSVSLFKYFKPLREVPSVDVS